MNCWPFLQQPQLASLCATSSRARPVPGHKPPQQEGLPGEWKTDQVVSGPSAQGINPGPAVENGSRSSTDSPSLGSTGDAGQK